MIYSYCTGNVEDSESVDGWKAGKENGQFGSNIQKQDQMTNMPNPEWWMPLIMEIIIQFIIINSV